MGNNILVNAFKSFDFDKKSSAPKKKDGNLEK
jgi:hypothetical protein